MYIVISTLPFVAMMTMNDRTGLPLMLLGGAVYAVGVVFFKVCNIYPYMHYLFIHDYKHF